MFDQAKADKLLAHVAEGKSVRSFVRDHKTPCLSELFVWLRDNPKFAEQYARAKEESADSLADELMDIADDPNIEPNDKRIRVDARKWAASKLKPKKYGDKLITENDHKLEVTIRDLSREDGK